MHEKERTSSHAPHRSPATGLGEYTKRKCAQLGTSSLTCRSPNEMLQYFCGTTCSVDATLRSARRVSRFPDYDPASRIPPRGM